jgi:hypothetical protein
MKDILSVRLESQAFNAGAVDIFELSGRETISQLFELELKLVSKDPAGLDEEALLSEPMTIIFLRGDTEVRRLFGMVVSVRDALQTETLHLAYTLTFVPRGGNNEINIDDTEGEERIKLSTPFGGTALQLGSPNTPEAGAAISTAEAFTAVGAAGVNTLTTVNTVISDIASILAASNILHYAGGATSLADALTPENVHKLADGIVKTAKSALDIPKKWDAYKQAQANEEVVKKDENAKRKLAYARMMAEYPAKSPPLVTSPDGTQRPMTQEEWEAQQPEFNEAREAAKEAAGAKADSEKLAEEIAEGEQTRRKIGVGLDATSGFSEAGKAVQGRVKERLNSAAQKRGRATDAASVAVAKSMAAGAGSAAKVDRVPGSVPSIGSPYFLGGADNSAALIGLSDAFVGGAACATLAAGGQAIVSGGGVAMLKSPGVVSVGAGVQALITGGAVVDLWSKGNYVAKANARAKFESGALMNLTSGSDLAIKSGSRLLVKAGGFVGIKAGANLQIQSSGALTEKAADIVHTAKTSAAVTGGGWGMKAKSGDVAVGGGGSGLMVSTGNTRIVKGSSACSLKSGSAELKAGGSKVTCGSGAVKLSGGRIDLG